MSSIDHVSVIRDQLIAIDRYAENLRNATDESALALRDGLMHRIEYHSTVAREHLALMQFEVVEHIDIEA